MTIHALANLNTNEKKCECSVKRFYFTFLYFLLQLERSRSYGVGSILVYRVIPGKVRRYTLRVKIVKARRLRLFRLCVSFRF